MSRSLPANKYQKALTKLHNLIESGEIIPETENENDGVIAGHSKDGTIKFWKDAGIVPESGVFHIHIEKSYGGMEHNFFLPLEQRECTIKLASLFQ